MSFFAALNSSKHSRLYRAFLWSAGIILLFAVYTFGISDNPPGFYVDESALCYNAYLLAKTGAGEFGPKWPLFFQIFTGGFTQYSNPTQIYLLAAAFSVFGPDILVARLLASASVFGASLLAGLLGAKLSGQRKIGIIVAAAALTVPWLFEVSRLALETFFYPMAIMLFLWALYLAHRKAEWRWFNVLAIALSLTLVTYSYTIGRVLGPLLAIGLISFAVSRKRLLAVLATWLVFIVTMIPLYVFNQNNPGLTTRFYLLTYFKPESSYSEILVKFIPRYFQDINPLTMLLTGDSNQRHHIPDAYGSMFIGIFLIAAIGVIVVVLTKYRDAWWRFVVYGLAASAVPGALTVDVFHTLRMIAFPVFVIVLMVPALEWLMSKREVVPIEEPEPDGVTEIFTPPRTPVMWPVKTIFVAILLAFTFVEASFFHWKYYMEGPKRGYVFDSAYKTLYDAAVAQPQRPIYLVDGYWGPMYIHSLWYATTEERDTSEFVHQQNGLPPSGAIVISSDKDCTQCEIIKRNGIFLLYKTN